jgi:hypothetical protein
LNYDSDLLQQAIASLSDRPIDRPSPDAVLQVLLAAEKASKQQKTRCSMADLVGDWRLCWITGTQKTRKRAGVVLGAGRYVPGFVTIQLSYTASPLVPDVPVESAFETGTMTNQVQCGPLSITLSGPAKLLKKNNILAFDFTRILLQLGNVTVYRGAVRGGATSEASFYQASVGKQAFFNYFLVQPNLLAARGRGGGLALWGRQPQN